MLLIKKRTDFGCPSLTRAGHSPCFPRNLLLQTVLRHDLESLALYLICMFPCHFSMGLCELPLHEHFTSIFSVKSPDYIEVRTALLPCERREICVTISQGSSMPQSQQPIAGSCLSYLSLLSLFWFVFETEFRKVPPLLA